MSSSESSSTKRNTWRQRLRTALTGLFFGFPIAVATPVSPFFRKSIKQNKNLPFLCLTSMVVSGGGAAVAYRLFLEPPSSSVVDNRCTPNLRFWNALIPAAGAWVACHLLYPGFFIVLGEPTWRQKFTEYRRLTLKATIAFGPSHFVVIGCLGLVIGAVIGRRNRRAEQFVAPPASKADSGRG